MPIARSRRHGPGNEGRRQPEPSLSRRDMMRVCGISLGGALLGGCGDHEYGSPGQGKSSASSDGSTCPAPAIVQQSPITGNVGTLISVSFSNPTTVGNTVLVAVGTNNAADVPNMAPFFPGPPFISQADSTDVLFLCVYMTTPATSFTTITGAVASSVNWMAVAIELAPTCGFTTVSSEAVAAAGDNGVGPSASVAGPTASRKNDLLLPFVLTSGASPTSDSGSTSYSLSGDTLTVGASPVMGLGVGNGLSTSAGAQSFTATLSAANNWIVVMPAVYSH